MSVRLRLRIGGLDTAVAFLLGDGVASNLNSPKYATCRRTIKVLIAEKETQNISGEMNTSRHVFTRILGNDKREYFAATSLVSDVETALSYIIDDNPAGKDFRFLFNLNEN
jgi:hypothetical protein